MILLECLLFFFFLLILWQLYIFNFKLFNLLILLPYLLWLILNGHIKYLLFLRHWLKLEPKLRDFLFKHFFFCFQFLFIFLRQSEICLSIFHIGQKIVYLGIFLRNIVVVCPLNVPFFLVHFLYFLHQLVLNFGSWLVLTKILGGVTLI